LKLSTQLARTAAYIDGFNLYYGALRGTPYKWLDLHRMCELVVPHGHQITLIKYFTAYVKPTPADPTVDRRQKSFLTALRAYRPAIERVFGRFTIGEATVEPLDPALPRRVRGRKPSEKGTDVNLAVHLLHDAWHNRYDVALVVSNDTDLEEAIRLVRTDCGKKVGLVPPVCVGNRKVSDRLLRVTDFQRELRPATLAAAQLPNPIPGTRLHKPPTW
jgi:uncharacterized LabA/DUF88 family protein